jgi:uncharacterized cupin superfamily protein
MIKSRKGPIDPRDIEARTGSGYPEPFRQNVMSRAKRALGNAFGLTRYGVNLVELPPGSWSSQRHWHTREDEFIYIVSGHLTLVTDEGEQPMTPGMVAGFPAGDPNGHHLINSSGQTASYLEIGDRDSQDEVVYPDIDLLYKLNDDGKHAYTNREGIAY